MKCSLSKNMRSYDASDPGVILSSLILNGSITKENFLDPVVNVLILKKGFSQVQEATLV